jgi:pyruvate,orthophosphate dikinase
MEGIILKKYVYFFGGSETEGNKDMKYIIGGKGANLAEMTSIGIPVPPGFTISTEACDEFYRNNSTHPEGMWEQVLEKLEQLQKLTGKKFGDAENPLLVSVRSGAAASMPGMMDTVLNLGMNDRVVGVLAKKTGNERFAWDAYRRFINMFGDVVMGVNHEHFEEVLSKVKETKGVELDTELDVEDLKAVVSGYKEVVRKHAGKLFPDEPMEQLKLSVNAVFGSWNNARAIKYRQLNNITGLLGTAVNVQTMVFGNMGDGCYTGVAFTRDPSNGENIFYGEYLPNAQGEDVVAGIRTPKPINELGGEDADNYKKLMEIRDNLERHYKEMQDIEFTIENRTLYMLQTRTGKRTGAAALRIAVDMVKEGMITPEEAVKRFEPGHLDQLLHPQFDAVALKKAEFLAKGIDASPGAAVGEAVFNADDAEKLAEEGKAVLLVRTETSPEDIKGMAAAKGILTARGGKTSHAAVVARGMGKPCVAGCGDISINEKHGVMIVRTEQGEEIKINKGDFISIDGTTGMLYKGEVPTKDPEITGDFAEFMEWVDKARKLKVRTNADTPADCKRAREFGAEGVGLCRTEHMFFEGDRITAVREMILADDLEGRKRAINKLLPMQREDFKGIFEVMSGLPVTIRLLDPPLHEFLPKEDREFNEVSKAMGVPVERLKQKASELHEFNPMLGHRGCRLGIYYPEITEMQVRAIFEAAQESLKEEHKPVPEIEVPLVGNVKELEYVAEIIKRIAKEMKINKKEIPYKIGTMIEVPRACVTADKIAKKADFFSFGTNDLTQMGLGFSRDDSGKFINDYKQKGILAADPFATVDQEGVGELMKLCVKKGRKAKRKLEIGICGEQGGEAESVKFCHRIGLNYVSCSPYRVPIARLAAAQAVIEEK